MPKHLDSVDPGGYVEPIDVAESDLQAVVDMLGLTDAQEAKKARNQIYAALEDLKTDAVRTVRAKTVVDDLRDLDELAKVASPEAMTAPISQAIDALESLRANNLVLHQRLKSLEHGREIRDLITALKDADEAVFVIGREIDTQLSALADEIGSENRSGRPTNWARRRFASRLSTIWVDFTGRGTSRQNRPGEEMDPFGDFVDAAGKLIDPDFEGHHHARQIHEARKEPRRGRSPSGEK